MLNSANNLEKTNALSDALLRRMERWFDDFTGGFPLDDPELAYGFSLKVEHTIRMVGLMREISEAEGLDVNLASACALLHDVGRFPQLLNHGTFVDAISVDHARLSCEVLEEHGVLEGLDDSIIQVIHGAVLHHNAKVIPEGLGHPILLYARALRDADKLDILFIHLDRYESDSPLEKIPGIQLPDNGRITPKVLESVRLGQLVSRSDLASLDDAKLLFAGWLHDLNTRRAFQIFQEHKYLERLFSAMSREEDLKNLFVQLKTLIEERSGRPYPL